MEVKRREVPLYLDVLRGDDAVEEIKHKDEDHASQQELHVEEDEEVNTVFQERPVLSLTEEEEKEEFPSSSTLTVNGLLDSSGLQFTQNAAVPVSSTDDNEQIITPPLELSGVDLLLGGVTSDSSVTDGGLWAAVDSEDLLLATDTPPPYLEELRPPSLLRSPLPLSPVDQALTRLNRPASFEPTNQSPATDTCDLSPSLVALELDSEEEEETATRRRPKSPLTPLSLDVERKEETMESCPPLPPLPPVLTCSRSLSTSACQPSTHEQTGEQGIRLRSYSYSSSKISLRPARVIRENHPSDVSADGILHSVSHSRSLLQALSLSKSLSLLHSAKQKTTNTSDQPQEKRDVRFRRRAQSADDDMELAESLQHLTLSEFLKEIEEEELDKYNIPAKAESEKYKVIRTFSFLKSRMSSSTRSKNKGLRGKDAKDRLANGHRFSSGSCLGLTLCVVCDKPAAGKELLHCSGCTVFVHKGCKESVPPCLKKLQDKYSVLNVKSRTSSLPQNFTVRDSAPQPSIPVSTSLPAMSPKDKRHSVSPSSSDSRLNESSEAESDVLKPTSQSEEPLLTTPPSSTSTDSSFGEDCVDSLVQSDVSADCADYEAESWSLTVEHKFCKKQEKRSVKRQDVIYELMQTELHHLQTLTIMAEVFRRGMKEEVHLDTEAVERVFPCLDRLLLFHHALFAAMKERRLGSAQPLGHRNYLIQRIGDVLLQQFSEENGEKMKEVYGEFCSHHNEAVSFFKELQQHNKRFQSFIKQQGNNCLVRRKEIPGCILLVTQRITKYPVLLERILQYTQEGTEEHSDLSKALAGIREVIVAVDLRVSEYERHQRLKEVWSRTENRSSAKLKNGHAFRKQDMMAPGQRLQHQGALLWKTATGRLKDVLALLLTDTLVFLQEKDQKFTFATVDQKPPVIALQKLIVREVANEEKGMFLISASAAGPEMYEVHTSSKEERNGWMRLIREAVESCPEEEEEDTSESEEEKRAAEARFQKILKLQETLLSHDQQICSSLEDKLHIHAQISVLSGRTPLSPPQPRLLVQPLSDEMPQAAVLLTAALQEAELLKSTLSSKSSSPSNRRQDADDSPLALSAALHRSPPDSPDASEERRPRGLVRQNADPNELKVAQSVQNLTQLLYSLQAAVALQDSSFEVQKLLLLQDGGRLWPRPPGLHLPNPRLNSLQEQEKQRNQEKQKEEAAAARRLRDALRQDKERWEKECQARENQQGALESSMEERERRCQQEAHRLRREREELEEQLQEYQQSLERLREGQRSVERERHRLESQQRFIHSCKHGRQSSLPAMTPHMVIPLDGKQDSLSSPSRDLSANGSMFVNEAALAAVNNRHAHYKMSDASTRNCLNALLATSHSRHPPAMTPPPRHHPDSPSWRRKMGFICSPAARLELHSTPSGPGVESSWSPAVLSRPELQPLPDDPQLDLSALVTMETNNGGEEGREETIVYL